MIVNSLEVRTQNNDAAGLSSVILDDDGITMASGTSVKVGSNYIYDKVTITREILAASVDNHIFTPTEGTWKLQAARYMPRVAGSDGGAVTLDIKSTSGVQAPSAGTTQLDATIDLKSTADTVQNADLIAAPTAITLGMSLALDFTGTMTAVVGTLTVTLVRTAL